MTDAINLGKFIFFVIVARFEVVTSLGSYNDFFLDTSVQQFTIFDGNDATVSGH